MGVDKDAKLNNNNKIFTRKYYRGAAGVKIQKRES